MNAQPKLISKKHDILVVDSTYDLIRTGVDKGVKTPQNC